MPPKAAAAILTRTRSGMARRMVSAPVPLWEHVEAFAERHGLGVSAAARHLIAVGLAAEATIAGWLRPEVRTSGMEVLTVAGDLNEELARVERPELVWGLQPLPRCFAAWGAKARYIDGELRFVRNRTDMWGPKAARDRLRALLEERLPRAELQDRCALVPDRRLVRIYEDDDVVMEARRSGREIWFAASLMTPVPLIEEEA